MNARFGPSTPGRTRFFPEISPALYDSVADAQASANGALETAEDVLKLSNLELSRWRLWTGRSLDPVQHLARLLWLHRSALSSELDGQATRAGFYWREIVRSLKGITRNDAAWQELDRLVPLDDEKEPNGGSGIRDRLFTELLIDTNLALLNGRLGDVESSAADGAALSCAETILQLSRLSGLSEDVRWAIAEPVADLLVSAYRERRNFKSARAVCNGMVDQFPERWKFQDILIDVDCTEALSGLKNGESTDDNREDAKNLDMVVANLESLKATFPLNPTVFDFIGLMQRIRAIKLANAGQVSDALLAIEQSLAHAPDNLDAQKIRPQLQELLQKMQQQAAMLSQQIAARPNATLTEEGQQLILQTRLGATAASEYVQSGKAANALESMYMARAARLCRTIGLPGSDDEVIARAPSVYEILNSVLGSKVSSPEVMKTLVAEAVRKHPELDESVIDLFNTYLEQRMFPPQQSGGAEAAGSGSSPVLDIEGGRKSKRKEPAAMWLLSPENVGVKAFSLLAVVALVASISFASIELAARNARDQHYDAVVDAVRADDENRVLEAASEFLDTPDVMGDGRYWQVDELHRLSVELPNQRIRDKAYDQLLVAVAVDDQQAVMEAAEAYLAAPPVHVSDARFAEVWEQYNAAFVAWFVAVSDPDSDVTQQRIAKFDRISSAIDETRWRL